MKVIFKIAEEQRKSEKGMKQLFNYICRDKAVYKTCGVGTPDEKKLAVDLFMINKKRFKKDVDEKYRFLEHSMITFEAGTDKDLIYKICEEFCEEAYLEKGFNSFFVIHEDKDNPHAHILTDNVNFLTGNMLISLTEEQYKKSDKKRQEKTEVVVYEQRRELIQDICIRNGYEIDEKEKYKYMHEQKVKEGRTWLKKNEFRTIQDEKSWRNVIKNKLEEIYNREDLKEDNIQDIAREYGLQVTRHNADKKSITFALTDEKGNPSKKERIKLERLKEQEQELLLRDDKTKTNIFEYDIFFKGREKEEEKTREETIKVEAPDDSHTELESDSKTYNINKTNNERNYIVDTDEDKEKDKKDFEKEKEYKNKIEDFYEKQEEIKANKIEAQKKLDEQIKADEKNKLNKLDEANETLRRLSIEEIERQERQEKLKKARKYLFDELKDFKVITDELEILDKENKIKYTEYNLYNYNNAVVQVFESLVNKIEFNNTEEEERGKKIVKNVYLFSDKTSIKENLEALDELILDNKKYKEEKIEAPDDSHTELESDSKTYNINKTNNERNYIVDTDEDKEKDKKDFEKEKEYKNKIEDFYEKQEEIKANKIEAQKKLDEQIKADEKNKLNKLDEANETLRRLSIEEIERQERQEKLKKARKYLFDELKDFKVITDELEILDKENKIKYTEYNLYNYNNAVVQVFESLVNKIEFNNTEEEERGKKIVKNVYLFSDKTSIKENLEALDELILDNKKYKEEKIEAPDDSYTELGTDSKTYNTSYEEEKIEAPDNSHTELESDSTTYNTSYEEEEKVEAPDIDRILKNIDLYEIVKTNEIFDILPDFTIYNQDGTLLYNSETQEINHSEASYYVKDSKGEEYWDNMNFKDIKEWSAIETLIVVCGEEEYKGYEDYAEKTIKNFLKNNLDIAKALDNDKTLISNEEEIKLDKTEDKEIDF